MIQQTSLDSYRDLVRSGTIGRYQLLAWTVLQQHGPLTGMEVDHHGGKAGLYKRLSELKRLGLVEESEVRECSLTGRLALTWKITNATPIRTKRKRNEKRRRWFILLAKESWETSTVHATEYDAKRWQKNLTDPDREIIEVREVIRSQ